MSDDEVTLFVALDTGEYATCRMTKDGASAVIQGWAEAVGRGSVPRVLLCKDRDGRAALAVLSDHVVAMHVLNVLHDDTGVDEGDDWKYGSGN